MNKWGTYVWTANAAGWTVIGLVTQLDAAFLCAIGCGIVSYLWWQRTKD